MSWLNLIDNSEVKPLPDSAKLVSDNGISYVFKGRDGWYYKRSIPYLVNNEYSFLMHMGITGFVPMVYRFDKYTLRIEDVGMNHPVSDEKKFNDVCKEFMFELGKLGIRHGDLTAPHVIVTEYSGIYVLDWAESRWQNDPAPDKRVEGDEYWMNKTRLEKMRNG